MDQVARSDARKGGRTERVAQGEPALHGRKRSWCPTPAPNVRLGHARPKNLRKAATSWIAAASCRQHRSGWVWHTPSAAAWMREALLPDSACRRQHGIAGRILSYNEVGRALDRSGWREAVRGRRRPDRAAGGHHPTPNDRRLNRGADQAPQAAPRLLPVLWTPT